jgi:CheY-like chemotaxis protein
VQARRRCLLLVDDEANILSALRRLLRPDGYEILSAGCGEQGLELLARQPVDVIISDQRMPGLSGADFLRQARILRPDTIRIMLSGYTELQSVTDAVNEGAIYKFLTKPWNDDHLRAHLRDAFRLKEIADDNLRLTMEVRNANHELASANRRMEQLLHQMQRQIDRDEISLNIAHDILQQLPLPVIGMDDVGMIAFVNGAAGRLFQRSALLGNAASAVLPALFPGGALPPPGHLAHIDGLRYAVQAIRWAAFRLARQPHHAEPLRGPTMSHIALDEVIRRIHDLPSLPAVVAELLSSMAQEDVDLHYLSGRIALDQALTAKTLGWPIPRFTACRPRSTASSRRCRCWGCTACGRWSWRAASSAPCHRPPAARSISTCSGARRLPRPYGRALARHLRQSPTRLSLRGCCTTSARWCWPRASRRVRGSAAWRSDMPTPAWRMPSWRCSASTTRRPAARWPPTGDSRRSRMPSAISTAPPPSGWRRRSGWRMPG